MNYNSSLNNNNEIGHVIIGSLGDYSGVCQWHDILHNAETPSTTWHYLKLNW